MDQIACQKNVNGLHLQTNYPLHVLGFDLI